MQQEFKTVFRIEKFDGENVFLHMIAYRQEPFWYPATEFLKAVNSEILSTAAEGWPLRFFGFANLNAENIKDLNIRELEFGERVSGDPATVNKHLAEDWGF